MKLTVTALALMAFGSSAFASDNSESMRTPGVDIPGYVAHGVNSFNGKPLRDFTKIAPNVMLFHVEPKLNEIGFHQPGQATPGTIVATTDRRLKVATSRTFHDFVSRLPINPALVNVPLSRVGSNFMGSPTPTDRISPVEFAAAANGPDIHLQKGVNANPTVGDWEKASGLMTLKKSRDGTSTVSFTIRNGFPHAVYTLWDLGVKNPSTNTSEMYAVPLGGLPNIVITDAKGCGFKQMKLTYQLDRSCAVGASSCSTYVSAFYHWDAQAYGASPDGSGYGLPIGLVGAIHLAFPTSGIPLQEPASRFPSRHHGCGFE